MPAVRSKRNRVNPLDKRIATLREDIEDLQDHMKTLVSDAGDAANTGVSEAVRATEIAAQQVLDDVDEWATGNADLLRDRVREQPLMSCILSLGAGALVGALFLRR
jgi:ElaB/YqjD/DUF883 family membrane-anchored ribosome-binding protein